MKKQLAFADAASASSRKATSSTPPSAAKATAKPGPKAKALPRKKAPAEDAEDGEDDGEASEEGGDDAATMTKAGMSRVSACVVRQRSKHASGAYANVAQRTPTSAAGDP